MPNYVHFDSDTNSAVVYSQEEMAQGMGLLFVGFAGLAAYALLAMAAMLVIISPFLVLAFLKDFIDGFVANNVLFFSLIAAIMLLLKLLPGTSGLLPVRIIFDVFVVVAALYIGLYVLRIDNLMYSLFKIADNYKSADGGSSIAELWDARVLYEATKNNWFYDVFNGYIGSSTAFLGQFIEKSKSLDFSAFQVPAAEIDIFKAIWTILSTGGYYIALCILIMLFVASVILIVIIVSALPGVLALAVVVGVNKLLFMLSTLSIQRITDKNYKESMSICEREVGSAINTGKYNTETMAVFIKAANAGNPLAQVTLADCYLLGEGVKMNNGKALSWYKKAARQGNPKSQYALAMMYYDGTGTSKNRPLARAWYKRLIKNENYIMRNRHRDSFTTNLKILKEKTKFSEYI